MRLFVIALLFVLSSVNGVDVYYAQTVCDDSQIHVMKAKPIYGDLGFEPFAHANITCSSSSLLDTFVHHNPRDPHATEFTVISLLFEEHRQYNLLLFHLNTFNVNGELERSIDFQDITYDQEFAAITFSSDHKRNTFLTWTTYTSGELYAVEYSMADGRIQNTRVMNLPVQVLYAPFTDLAENFTAYIGSGVFVDGETITCSVFVFERPGMKLIETVPIGKDQYYTPMDWHGDDMYALYIDTTYGSQTIWLYRTSLITHESETEWRFPDNTTPDYVRADSEGHLYMILGHGPSDATFYTFDPVTKKADGTALSFLPKGDRCYFVMMN